MTLRIPGLVLLGALTACAPRNAGFDSVQTLVRERAGLDTEWRQLADGAAIEGRLAALLAEPVGPEEAVTIALLRSAELQARFEELGIARGQLVQASLPANIEVDGDIGDFTDGRRDFGLAATTDLARLFFLPLRRGVATAALEAVRIEAAGTAIAFAHQVRSAFYDYQAAEQLLELDRTVLEAAAASYDAARRLYDAGNITALELANERVFYEEARSEAALAEGAALGRRETLNAWMGLSGAATSWELAGRLAEPTSEGEIPDAGALEAEAIAQSLDLLGLEHRYTESARRANLARAEGLIPSLRAGAQVGREEGLRQAGPVVSIELPVFDQGRGRVEAARAEMRQVEQRYEASAVRIRAAVRTAHNDLVVATRRVEHYRTVLLPLREEIIDETGRQYNAMQVGIFQLLTARREQVRTGQEYVLALRAYWQARSRLDQILAGAVASPPENTFEMPERR